MSTTRNETSEPIVTEVQTDASVNEASPMEVEQRPEARGAVSAIKVLLACLAGVIIPGAGQMVLGRWARGIVLALSIVAMFAMGLFWMDGHLYSPRREDPVSIFPFIANAGMGGIYLLCYGLKYGFESNPELPTFEYGNTFLLVAGLLNYLVMLDAYDLAVGRKK